MRIHKIPSHEIKQELLLKHLHGWWVEGEVHPYFWSVFEIVYQLLRNQATTFEEAANTGYFPPEYNLYQIVEKSGQSMLDLKHDVAYIQTRLTDRLLEQFVQYRNETADRLYHSTIKHICYCVIDHHLSIEEAISCYSKYLPGYFSLDLKQEMKALGITTEQFDQDLSFWNERLRL